jgi:hypothetical protein
VRPPSLAREGLPELNPMVKFAILLFAREYEMSAEMSM